MKRFIIVTGEGYTEGPMGDKEHGEPTNNHQVLGEVEAENATEAKEKFVKEHDWMFGDPNDHFGFDPENLVVMELVGDDEKDEDEPGELELVAFEKDGSQHGAVLKVDSIEEGRDLAAQCRKTYPAYSEEANNDRKNRRFAVRRVVQKVIWSEDV